MERHDQERSAPQAEHRREERHESRTATTFRRFIDDVCARTSLDEAESARAVGVVLAMLERRLMPGSAKNLEAQLPDKIREILAECERPLTGGKLEKLDREDFVRGVESCLEVRGADAEKVVRDVFAVVRDHISDGEAEKISAQLPRELASLWAPPP